jgi:hypothetical protein
MRRQFTYTEDSSKPRAHSNNYLPHTVLQIAMHPLYSKYVLIDLFPYRLYSLVPSSSRHSGRTDPRVSSVFQLP